MNEDRPHVRYVKHMCCLWLVCCCLLFLYLLFSRHFERRRDLFLPFNKRHNHLMYPAKSKVSFSFTRSMWYTISLYIPASFFPLRISISFKLHRSLSRFRWLSSYRPHATMQIRVVHMFHFKIISAYIFILCKKKIFHFRYRLLHIVSFWLVTLGIRKIQHNKVL